MSGVGVSLADRRGNGCALRVRLPARMFSKRFRLRG